MFERFTERARQVVVLAQDEARALKHDYIGTEHILLGLIREEEGLAARALASFEITAEQVRVRIGRMIGEGHELTSGQIPFTPRAKRVLELSLREALSMGHDYIGTEHVLLGLARENEGVAARILLDLGAEAGAIRTAVAGMLSGAEAPSLPPRPTLAPVSPHPAELREWPHVRHVESRLGWGLDVLALLPGAVVAAVGFPLGLLVGWVIWG